MTDRRLRIAMALAALLLLGCRSEKPVARRMSERERDSTIAREPLLPGSRVVGRALEETDAARARAAQMNAMADSLPR